MTDQSGQCPFHTQENFHGLYFPNRKPGLYDHQIQSLAQPAHEESRATRQAFTKWGAMLFITTKVDKINRSITPYHGSVLL